MNGPATILIRNLLVDVPAGPGLLPELFAILALAVLIYGLRDAWRGIRQWLAGRGSLTHTSSELGGSAAETAAPVELSADLLTESAPLEAALPAETVIAPGSLTAASPSARAAALIASALTEAQLIISAERAPDAPAGPAMAEALVRFEAIIGRMVERTDQLALCIGTLTEAVGALAAHTHSAPASAATPAAPSFEPSAEGIDLVVAGTPGFQGLMEIQHALARLPQTQSAAVLRYEHDEAEYHLVLLQPMTAAAIAAVVGAGRDAPTLIELAAPDARRLVLRIAEG